MLEKSMHLRAALSALSFVGLLSGCDSGEYNRRYESAIQRSAVGPATRAGAGARETRVFDTATPLSATADVKLCLPKIFDSQSKNLTPPAPRAQPPFVILPGFQYAREAFLEDHDKKKLPCYCYVAFESTAGSSSKQIRERVLRELENSLSSVSSQEENTTGPNGEKINWLRISSDSNQGFDATPQGGRNESRPGRFVAYLIATPQHEVIVAWRAPNSLAEKVQFFEAVDEAMKTLQGDALPKN